MQRNQNNKKAAKESVATGNEQFHGIVILGYTTLTLIVLEYFGRPEFFHSHFPGLVKEHFGLYPHLWWAIWTFVLFLLVPALIVKLLFKARMADFGFNLKIKRRYFLIYLGLFLIALPLVIYTSTRADFRAIYPFFRGAFSAPRSDVVVWELAYLSTFVALEFFFRGFLVLGLERHFGKLAIWVALVPYVMLHFHKPPLEAFGAILTGLILGELAQRSRSILGGALVHVGVASTMDFLALNRLLAG